MKYEFKVIDSDTTELKYKDKTFTIKKDIDLEKRIQESIPRARMLMLADLKKMGMTKKDLVIERKEGDKTYYDNTNVLEAEEQYTDIATMQVYDEIVQKYCGMKLSELMNDIGLDVNSVNQENEQFGLDLTKALLQREEQVFPSEPKEENK